MAVAISEALPGSPIGGVERRQRPVGDRQAAAETSTFRKGLAVVIDELRPYEGRLAMTLRMTLSVVIVVAFMMSQQVPEAVLSCYLVFFASRKDAGSGMLIALALIVAVTFGIALGLVMMQLSADNSMVRLMVMAGFAFGGMYLSQASRLGSLGVTAGFVSCSPCLSSISCRIPQLFSHALSWIWVVVALPMAVLFLVSMLFSPNPAVLARTFVAERLRAAAALLAGVDGADVTAGKLLGEASSEIGTLTRGAKIFGYLSGDDARKLGALAQRASELLALAQASRCDPALAEDIFALAEAIAENRHDVPAEHARHTCLQTAALADEVDRLAMIWSGRIDDASPAAAPQSLLFADAASNPAYWQFAFKTVIAVFITYTIYTAWDWYEVHTAMITCFYVALGSTGETLHKAALRITGALIGGAMGIGTIVFLMPHMTDIGHFLLLIGLGSFIAAWVASGSELIRYAGWQMALAFFLCVLPTVTTSFLPSGFGPVFDTSVATERVLGILIGNVVVALVFLSLWPTSVSEPLSKTLGTAARLVRDRITGMPARMAEIWENLNEARRLAGLSHFEVSRLRFSSPLMRHVPTILGAVETSATTLADIELLRQRPRYLFGAPRCAKAALSAHESATAAFLVLAASAIVAPEPQARHMLRAALTASASTLDRLNRLTGRLDKRARWHDDLVANIAAYRRLHADLEQAVRALA